MAPIFNPMDIISAEHSTPPVSADVGAVEVPTPGRSASDDGRKVSFDLFTARNIFETKSGPGWTISVIPGSLCASFTSTKLMSLRCK